MSQIYRPKNQRHGETCLTCLEYPRNCYTTKLKKNKNEHFEMFHVQMTLSKNTTHSIKATKNFVTFYVFKCVMVYYASQASSCWFHFVKQHQKNVITFTNSRFCSSLPNICIVFKNGTWFLRFASSITQICLKNVHIYLAFHTLIL